MRILIKTPSRLHFSLIDENGTIGRIDGGIGLSLNNPSFKIEVSNENKEFVEMSEKQRIVKTKLGEVLLIINCTDFGNSKDLLEITASIVKFFIQNLLVHECINILKASKNFPIEIKILECFPPHIGIGSKTQLSLAIARGICEILALNIDIVTLTKMVKRGGTSGIGYRAFETGGFILDCGHKYGIGSEKETFLPSSASNADPAKLLLRYDFPEDWPILLVTLDVPTRISDDNEVNIFQKNCPIPIEEVMEISHIILMKLLPGIIERDLETFGGAINKIQQIGFKKIEINLQHDKVIELINFQKDNGAKCVGISSFGPTVFSIFKSESDIDEMLEKIKKEFKDIVFKSYTSRVNNSGAQITKITKIKK
ncbi:MAG: beta-ribofuranosylaminobenzene 5'-phosphate synthase family protein [Promethearchaeota archaeon]